MFAEMKNKLQKKSGGELPKLPNPVLLRGKHSRQSSGSSVGSVSQENVKEDISSISSFQKRNSLDCNGSAKSTDSVSDSSPDLKLKQLNSEKLPTDVMDEKEKLWKKKEQTYVEDLLTQTKELQAALKTVEDYEKKFSSFQEEKEQIENFQTQEMAKIKHLLLAKENENSANLALLKENETLLESLKAEVNRLRPFEEKVSNLEDDIECLRHTSERERWQLSSKLAQSEEEIRHLQDRVAVLSRRAQAECVALGAQLSVDDRIQSLLGERTLLERRLEEAHIHLSEIKSSWSEKISYLETQVERLGRQAVEEGLERRKTEEKIEELEKRIKEYDEEKVKLLKKVDRLVIERDSLVDELKNFEQKNVAVSQDRSDLLERLNEVTEKNSLLETKYQNLKAELNKKMSNSKEERDQLSKAIKESKEEIKILKETILRERLAVEGVKKNLIQERDKKDDALMRNAEISMKAQLTETEFKRLKQENEELLSQIKLYECTKKDEEKSPSSEESASTNELNSKLVDLENQLVEKNKTVRVLQQRMSDLKKMLQKEMVSSAESNCNSRSNAEADINLKYIKHVVIKFLTCREYEAQHLTRAIVTVLRMSPDEEKLLRETIDWRMSWFGSRPRLQNSPR